MPTDTSEKEIKITKEVLAKVEELTKELFKLIGVEVEIEISEDKDNNAVLVGLKSENSAGLIIGRRGETISAIQYILGMMMRNTVDGWVRVIVNVGDWREKQEEQLVQMAKATADRARETGEPQTLYNLTPSQRRIIHVTLSEEKDIVTESQGEGRERHLVVSSKD